MKIYEEESISSTTKRYSNYHELRKPTFVKIFMGYTGIKWCENELGINPKMTAEWNFLLCDLSAG